MSAPSPDVVALTVRLGNALGTAARPAASLTAELTAGVAGIRALFGAAACSCALIDADGSSLRFVAAEGLGAAAIIGVELPVGGGIAGWVAISGQPIVVSDVQTDARFARDIAEATQYIPQSIAAAPMLDEAGDTIGVVEVLDPQARGEHSGRDLDVLGLVASQLATVVRLSSVFDALGTTLIRALTGASTHENFGGALEELAAQPDDTLASLALSFHDLAAKGPEGMRLATTVLREVAAFARSRR